MMPYWQFLLPCMAILYLHMQYSMCNLHCAGLCGGAAVPQQQRGPGPGPGLLRPARRGPGGGRHRAGT